MAARYPNHFPGGRTASGRTGGRGPHSVRVPTTAPRIQDSGLKGLDANLPYLHYGGSNKDNRPIEFLRAIGEYCDVKLRPSIGPAFSSISPAYGEYDQEPILLIAEEGKVLSTIETQEYLHL